MSALQVRPVTISALGCVSWDHLYLAEHYPEESDFSYLTDTQFAAGGTTGNLVMAASKLGAELRFFSVVGNDDPGRSILATYEAAGVDMSHTRTDPGVTDLSVVIVSQATSERTILWQKGPFLRRGDRIDIPALFGADLVVLDSVDHDLRRFLTDLPAHTLPGTRILGPLSYQCDLEHGDTFEVALRHDVLIGNEREFMILSGDADPDRALSVIQARMPGSNCRLAIMTRGGKGSSAVARDQRWDCPAWPVEARDTTGAGDAFAGAVAFALAQRWDVGDMLRFASVVAGAVVATVGAQAGQPDLQTVMDLMGRRA